MSTDEKKDAVAAPAAVEDKQRSYALIDDDDEASENTHEAQTVKAVWCVAHCARTLRSVIALC